MLFVASNQQNDFCPSLFIHSQIYIAPLQENFSTVKKNSFKTIVECVRNDPR